VSWEFAFCFVQFQEHHHCGSGVLDELATNVLSIPPAVNQANIIHVLVRALAAGGFVRNIQLAKILGESAGPCDFSLKFQGST
jgi:hypothetical protein